MKKSIRSLAVLGVCALSLTACGNVSFADFQTKANEALKTDVEYKTATVSGTVKSSSSDSKSESKISANLTVNGHILTGASINDAVYAAYITTFGLGTFAATENTSYKYYAGSSFKVTYDEKDDNGNKSSSAITWNSNGLVTSIKAKGTGTNSKSTYNLTVKYSK